MMRLRLRGGGYTLIDDADYEWAHQWRWRSLRAGYVVRDVHADGTTTTLLLHRELAARWGWEIDGLVIDHRNSRVRDNRRCNLRAVTPSQNCMNARRSSRNSSGIKGVTPVVIHGRRHWRARIQIDYARRELGIYGTRTAAAAAYAAAVAKHCGEYGRVDDGGITRRARRKQETAA